VRERSSHAWEQLKSLIAHIACTVCVCVCVGVCVLKGGGVNWVKWERRKTVKRKKNDLIFFRLGATPTYIFYILQYLSVCEWCTREHQARAVRRSWEFKQFGVVHDRNDSKFQKSLRTLRPSTPPPQELRINRYV